MTSKTMVTPALSAFLAEPGQEKVLAQVLICRQPKGFELRHSWDRQQPASALRAISLNDLRALAQFTASGAFRPLKSAPDLVSGWRLRVETETELETALNQLYPGALADWHAIRQKQSSPAVTNYRDFTQRQTGIYRVTSQLTDLQAAQVIRACCPARFCLKCRLWTVGQEPVDQAADKSLIPCLEPCAVLLELARKAFRLEQAEKAAIEVSQPEIQTLLLALGAGSGESQSPGRHADFDAPDNPRRRQLLYEKLKDRLKLSAGSETNEAGE